MPICHHPAGRFTPVALLILLPSCASLPQLGVAPTIASPAQFESRRTIDGDDGGAWPITGWWTAYGDPQLDALIAEALVASPDLSAAAARVRSADAAARVSRAALLPTLDAQGAVGVAKQSYNNGIPEAFLPKGWNGTARVNGVLDFDLDLWGGNRASFAAARSEADAVRLDGAQAALLLSTNIADAYADLARLFAERKVQITALDVRRQTESLTRDRVASGLDTQAELKQASSAVPAARADLAATDEQIALTRNRLAALLGKGPDRGLTITGPAISVFTRALPEGVTTNLVGRRPDVVAARVRVEAAGSRIKIARAAFYPAINLNAVVGFQSLGVGNVFKGGSSYGNAAPALSLPIFHGGELRGRYRGARADYDEAVARYDGIVSDAFRQVADAVTSRQALSTRLSESRASLTDAQAAYSVARQRYEGGLSTFLEVLTAQDRALTQLRVVTDLEARAFSLDVALVRALGGGFAAPAAIAIIQPTNKDDHHG